MGLDFKFYQLRIGPSPTMKRTKYSFNGNKQNTYTHINLNSNRQEKKPN